jgi:hypothetical protein
MKVLMEWLREVQAAIDTGDAYRKSEFLRTPYAKELHCAGLVFYRTDGRGFAVVRVYLTDAGRDALKEWLTRGPMCASGKESEGK